MPIEREEIFFASRQALRDWLSKNSGRATGIWAVYPKKSSGQSDLSWEAIVEECLCAGWIDSLPGKVDDVTTKTYISPRKKNSGWSRRNKDLLVDLEKRHLMTDAGRAVVQEARANGSWTRFDLAEDLIISDELARLFKSDKQFARDWDALSDARKRQFLQRIYDAKTEETRMRRMLETKESIER